MTQHCLFVLASFAMFLAFLASGIGFFAPYWLGKVTSPIPGSGGGLNLEDPKQPYITVIANSSEHPADYQWRGLWAQCSSACQWFWNNDFQLQNEKFNKLEWHLATQVIYCIGVFLVLFCEIFARVQTCCKARMVIYRTIGFVLLSSFVLQAAALAVFGGFANRDYGASAFVSSNTYLAWSYWMAVTGGSLTLVSGILFLLLDCVEDFEE